MSNSDEADIQALIFDAQVRGLPQTMPVFPWEQNVFRPIFQDEVLVLPRLAPPAPPPPPAGDEGGASASFPTNAPRMLRFPSRL